MKVLWRYLKPQRKLIALALLLAGASQVLALVDPIIFGWIIDDYAIDRAGKSDDELIRGALALLALAVLVAVLRDSACAHLLDKTGEGLATRIGEMGMKLSGGERQRLAIARALLRQPRLLVFDEATSALDSLTEEQITETVRRIASERERITIMIAHRLSTIMHADTIHVLEKGRIVESGAHDDLVARKGLYYAMWRQQIGERPWPPGPKRDSPEPPPG